MMHLEYSIHHPILISYQLLKVQAKIQTLVTCNTEICWLTESDFVPLKNALQPDNYTVSGVCSADLKPTYCPCLVSKQAFLLALIHM